MNNNQYSSGSTKNKSGKNRLLLSTNSQIACKNISFQVHISMVMLELSRLAIHFFLEKDISQGGWTIKQKRNATTDGLMHTFNS